MKQIVRTRIAPSPTGEDLHIGNLYTALINYVFAKKNKGEFIVRIEDTDRIRFNPQSEKKILASLKWLGIDYTESPDLGGKFGPYRQSERLAIYKKHAEKLIKEGSAYYCFCTPQRLTEMRKKQDIAGLPPKYDGRCRKLSLSESKKRILLEKYVVRFKVPDKGITTISDMIRGKIKFQNKLIDDQVLLKSDGYPTYHLAVVVDDHLMEISHIIRGEDWISSTPKHVLLYWAFGWTLPYFAHLPLLRNPDKSKLSKRKNPVWTLWYREQGFLPEALRNYLSMMAWSMPEGQDKFSLSEMISEFKLESIKTTAPIFDLDKLKWLNGEYIRELSVSELIKRLKDFLPQKTDSNLVSKLIPLAKDRMKTLTDFNHYLTQFIVIKPIKLTEKEKNIAKQFMDLFTHLVLWTAKELELQSKKLVTKESLSLKESFMILRIATTGEKIGLPLFETLEILGKEEVLKRLRKAC